MRGGSHPAAGRRQLWTVDPPVDGGRQSCRWPVLAGRAHEAAAAGLEAADFEEEEDESDLVEEVSDFAVWDLAFDPSDLVLSDFALAALLAASRLSVR